ncbi:MAG: uncharacterized protein KVP18_004737 [Porospora cf. gigantea A]|nr:MAG: hypothetical protein KVP18_004737 [Porospora cf. gigantea A]
MVVLGLDEVEELIAYSEHIAQLSRLREERLTRRKDDNEFTGAGLNDDVGGPPDYQAGVIDTIRDHYRESLPSDPKQLLEYLEKKPAGLNNDPNFLWVVQQRLKGNVEGLRRLESLKGKAVDAEKKLDEQLAEEQLKQQQAAKQEAKQRKRPPLFGQQRVNGFRGFRQ